jgi:hypothetical protein
MDIQKAFKFKDFIDWFKLDWRQESWTCVYISESEEMVNFDLQAILVPKNQKTNFLKQTQWGPNITDFSPRFVHYSDKPSEYFRWGVDSGYEPIVFQQQFFSEEKKKVLIVEEFILFYNLQFDPHSNVYHLFESDGNKVVVIEYFLSEIRIKTKFLREFLYAKNLLLGVQVVSFRFTKHSLDYFDVSEGIEISKFNDEFCYSVDFQDQAQFISNHLKNNSRFVGKKILPGFESIEMDTIYDEYLKKAYCDFIISENIDTGEPIYHTCNPVELEIIHEVTPVFFRREVLSKYFGNPDKYSVEDNYLKNKVGWRLKIDNNNPNYVVVFLNDIGGLPHNEQLHFKQYNVPPDGKISKTTFSREFLGQFTEPEMSDLIFKTKYIELNKKWEDKFGFRLFKELSFDDKHNFNTIHIPVTEDIAEFDQLVLSLSKVLIDSINMKAIGKHLTPIEKEREINKLERYLYDTFQIKEGVDIGFLRKLNNLRSSGSAHSKGKRYKKALTDFGIEELSKYDGFKKILDEGIKMLNELLRLC